MKKSIYIVFLLLVFTGLGVSAQQYSITSQYLTNGLIINPAYAGSRGAMSANAAYRQQWLKIHGAPQFQNLTIHSPINNKERVALGFMVNRLSYAITNSTAVNAFYAYSVPLWKGRLSFGMKAGVEFNNVNYDDVKGVDPGDELFQGKASYTLPNFGAGAYYYSDKLFAGLSIPSLLSFRHSAEDEYKVFYDYRFEKVFFTAGGLITVSPFFKIKPSILIRYAVADPVEADLNANFIIGDLISLGGSYRLAEKAVVALVDLQVTPQLRIGYSFDYQTGHLNDYTSGTHEVSLRYEFEFKVSAASPRYF